jgi:hypothetical protein
MGEYNSSNHDWTPWIWDKAFASLDDKEKKRIHWKWFNQSSDGKGDKHCQNYCGDGKCCRNHEKIYMSKDNILISSGHPERGYYSDINGINNDVLFLKAPGLAGVYNTHYKQQWKTQALTINSKDVKDAYDPPPDDPTATSWVNPNWDVFTTPVTAW